MGGGAYRLVFPLGIVLRRLSRGSSLGSRGFSGVIRDRRSLQRETTRKLGEGANELGIETDLSRGRLIDLDIFFGRVLNLEKVRVGDARDMGKNIRGPEQEHQPCQLRARRRA